MPFPTLYEFMRLTLKAKLDAVEKKIKVTEINTKRTNEDIAVLNNLTTLKETELAQLEEAYQKNSTIMQDTSTRYNQYYIK